MKYSFSGRVALVTGAGSGIGEAIARLLASNGLSVVVSDVSADNAQRVAKLISADGGQAVANVADVARINDVEAAVACAVDMFGGLHFAVNNAGISGDQSPVGELDPAAWSRVIDINLNGVFYGLRHQIPAILRSGGGAIVNVSSILGGGRRCRKPSVRRSQARCYRADPLGSAGLCGQGSPDQLDPSRLRADAHPGFPRRIGPSGGCWPASDRPSGHPGRNRPCRGVFAIGRKQLLCGHPAHRRRRLYGTLNLTTMSVQAYPNTVATSPGPGKKRTT